MNYKNRVPLKQQICPTKTVHLTDQWHAKGPTFLCCTTQEAQTWISPPLKDNMGPLANRENQISGILIL